MGPSHMVIPLPAAIYLLPTPQSQGWPWSPAVARQVSNPLEGLLATSFLLDKRRLLRKSHLPSSLTSCLEIMCEAFMHRVVEAIGSHEMQDGGWKATHEDWWGVTRTQVLEDTAPKAFKLSSMLITDITCKQRSVGFAVTCNNKKVPIRNETPGGARL